MMFRLDAERAHDLGIRALEAGLAKGFAGGPPIDPEILGVEAFGVRFSGPIGIAAGFDKNGRVVNQLADLGFGSVEVGTVTFQPQPGNPKPRLFRLPQDQALINRLGFNNDGAHVIAERLRKLERKCVVGVNIGKNKDVPNDEAAENYVRCFEIVHPAADYIAINVSSPNTPGLREMQRPENLEDLLRTLQKRNEEMGAKPLLVKIAPDLEENELEAIVASAVQFGLAGIIATNTTVERDGLQTKDAARFGSGGLSGKPLMSPSTKMISSIHRLTHGKLPVIGVGGVFTAEDAFAKIAAGACLVQVYTGFVYGGPSFANEIGVGLAGILRSRGFSNVLEAVGSVAADR